MVTVYRRSFLSRLAGLALKRLRTAPVGECMGIDFK